MKKLTTKLLLFCTAIIITISLVGCFVILTINQPSTALGGAKITTTMQVEIAGISDVNPHYGIVGLLVPNDWTIDSVKFSGAYNDFCTFLHPDSSDSEPGGKVDYWADSLEGRYPSGADMQWLVYQSSQAHAVLTTTDTVTLEINMETGLTQGNFNIGYFVTDAALDFDDPVNYSVSLDNAISISGVVPVELTSFAVSVDKNGINLKWETATETNNRGFEIQRSADKNTFMTVGFVEGKGTTTNKNSYTYADKNLNEGNYSYRLKQLDYNGTFEYSKVMEVNYSVPEEYVLLQNFPNPFNPSTSIKFGIPVDAKVVVTIYNSVGEEVAILANNNFTAGKHTLKLNAEAMPSGTYIYRVSAEGIDGSRFVQSNKMILLK